MKIYLILLQLTILASCSTFNGASNFEREPASPVQGDNCYLIVQDFFKAKPNVVKAKFEERLIEYEKLNKTKKDMLGRLVEWGRGAFTTKYTDEIKHTFDGLLFIDYKHSSDTLYRAANGEVKLNEAGLYKIYGKSFDNYKNAAAYLEDRKPPFTFDTLKTVHKFMMEGGIDNIDPAAVGKARVVALIGNVPRQFAIPQTFVDEMNKNIYLSTEGLVKDAVTGKYTGSFAYPAVTKMKPELSERLKTINPQLHADIQKYVTQKIGNQEELTSRMVTALSEDLMRWFVKNKDDLGAIDTPEKLYEFSKLVAVFQRDLISIHPFRDGNGRSVRQFAIYHAFESIGFPPPRLVSPDDDVYVSIDEWTDAIIDGIRNTQRLYDNAEKRLARGLALETTPELLVARFKETEKISYKVQKPESIKIDAVEKKVEIEQVQTYFMLRLKDENLRKRMSQEPTVTYNELLKDYAAFYKKSNIDYVHEKKGLEHVSVNLIDADFLATFGNRSFRNSDLWKEKMDKWYIDETIWRGLSRRNQEIREDEILTMFKTVNSQFVSNNVGRQLTGNMTPEQMNKIIFADFKQYNEDLLTDGLEKMAKDHSESGPMYGRSYGYSTSTKREVGKAFAMGAMVIAEYGKHKEMQHLLKSRVLVGMKQANKDVTLPRLKQLRPIFSYKYPRQQEVMGIGAADPDSVMFVQLIDAEGGVIKSYVRNPKKPNEIMIFNKEVSSVEEIDFNNLENVQRIILE
jgi:hypothetical protein